MADSRINLLSTATSSIGDDFLPIDGTTNGTRKLSAFSPSFGGNATVGGTLTVGSNLTVSGNIAYIGASGSGTGGGLRVVDDGGTTRWLAGLSGVAGARDYIIYDIVSTRQPISISSSTGAVTMGGNLTVTGALTTSSIVNNGANGVALDTGGSASLRFTDSATSKWWIYKLSGDPLLYFRDMVNARMQMVMSPGATSSAALTSIYSGVAIDSTTASTTASSGALVVSGGLGVGGAINAGGAITAGSDGSLVAVYVPGDSALRAAGGKLYLDTRLTDGGDIVLRPRISAALTLTAATNAATFTGAVSVSSTTASTSTSSGALVVGNGTSGGLGVGGNIYGGGNIVSTAAGGRFLIFGTGNTTESKELTFKRSDDADNFTLGLTGSAYAGSLSGLGNNEAYLYNSSASAFRIFIGTAATNRFDFTQSQFKINATTASTSTSSGALVVSGGVGVAGNTNIGGALRFHTNTALPGTASISKDATFGLNFYASTGSTYDFTIFNAAGTGLLVNPTGTSALTAFDTFTATGTLIANAASNAFRITTAQTPASAAATGTAGTIAWDSSYIYVCTATNTWKRAAIATW
jgi:hypothetical protein